MSEGFISRWSRVKRQTQDEQQQEQQAAPAAAPSATVAETAAAAEQQAPPAGDAPPLTDADMPPIESLTESSDLAPFMSGGVSDALKRKAFRKIFLGGRFNVRDGLDDYDEDFTNFTPLGDVITAEYRRWRDQYEKRWKDAGTEAETESSVKVDDADETETPAEEPVETRNPLLSQGQALRVSKADASDSSNERE